MLLLLLCLKDMNDNFETRKFTGYHANDVTIIHKEEILKTIDTNIVDKDLALDFIVQLEKDAADFITKGKITGVPYIGKVSFKYGSIALKKHIDELNEAKKHLDREQYVAFKKSIANEANNHAKYESFFRYRASMTKNRSKNAKTYMYLVSAKGEDYAILKMFCHIEISAPMKGTYTDEINKSDLNTNNDDRG